MLRDESKGDVTSFATLRTDLMPRSTRPFQSRALSSDPIHIPGIICTGPSMYGTEREPSSSSLRRIREAVGFMAGKEIVDSLG